MNTSGWLQLAFFSLVLLALTKPMGLYLVRVLDAQGRTCLDPVLKPVERLIYRLAGIDPAKEQDWKSYAVSVLIFSVVGLLLTYLILRLQYFLPLNPQGFSGVAGDLAFNTAASFTTNTNWQNYGGESTLSYLSQMVGLTFHNFVSSAAGIAIAAAMVRASPGIRPRPWQLLDRSDPELPLPAAAHLFDICRVSGLPGDDPKLQQLPDRQGARFLYRPGGQEGCRRPGG